MNFIPNSKDANELTYSWNYMYFANRQLVPLIILNDEKRNTGGRRIE